MCNDEARNVVIYSLNANIHVFVHEDLNEIYLYNVKKIFYGISDNSVGKIYSSLPMVDCRKLMTMPSVYNNFIIAFAHVPVRNNVFKKYI
jgi:hypothetical protein